MGEEIAYRCRDFIGVSLSLRNDRYRRQVTTQLVQLRIELATVMEKLNASADILKRTVIESPLAGTVLNMRFKTEGGVLKATEPILDIVPAEDMRMIDAKFSPTDIDVVRAGLTAKVQLTAYSSRSVPRVNGRVRSVSADRLTDDATRQPYYLAACKSTGRKSTCRCPDRPLPQYAGRCPGCHWGADDGRVSVPSILGGDLAQIQGGVSHINAAGIGR
jgi:hypothetical protein